LFIALNVFRSFSEAKVGGQPATSIKHLLQLPAFLFHCNKSDGLCNISREPYAFSPLKTNSCQFSFSLQFGLFFPIPSKKTPEG
jgi:hypothetical protein